MGNCLRSQETKTREKELFRFVSPKQISRSVPYYNCRPFTWGLLDTIKTWGVFTTDNPREKEAIELWNDTNWIGFSMKSVKLERTIIKGNKCGVFLEIDSGYSRKSPLDSYRVDVYINYNKVKQDRRVRIKHADVIMLVESYKLSNGRRCFDSGVAYTYRDNDKWGVFTDGSKFELFDGGEL